MKHLLCLLSISFLFLISCTKDEINIEKELINVNFKTENFDYEITTLKTSGEAVQFIEYVLCNESGKFLKNIRFDANDQIQDKLAEGNYTVAFLVHNQESSSIVKSGDALTLDNYYWSDHDPLMSSLFFGKEVFSINNEQVDPIIVELERLTGQLKLEIGDISAETDRVEIQMEAMPTGFCLGNLNASYFAYDTYVRKADNLLFNFIIDTSEDAQLLHEILITCLDINGKTLAVKTVSNIPIERNRVTILRGNMFSNSNASTNSFTYSLLKDWGEDIEMTF